MSFNLCVLVYLTLNAVNIKGGVGSGAPRSHSNFADDKAPGDLIPYFFGYKTEFFFLPKQSKRSRSVLQDGSRSFGLFRKGKIGIIAKFHRTDLII